MDDGEEPGRLPNAALFGLIVSTTGWLLTLVSLLARGKAGPTIACAVASTAATVFLATVGRKAAAPYWGHGGNVVITAGQAFLVVLYLLAFGCLFAWIMKSRNV